MRILLAFLLLFLLADVLLVSVFSLYNQNRTTSLGKQLQKQISDTIGTNNALHKQTSIILTGDVMLGRAVMTTSLDKNDPTYPFKKVSGTLNKADLVFVNLENPIVTNCPRTVDGFKFCADPKMIEGLKYSGIDVVNLANNHILNYGKQGVDETKKYLTDNGIDYVGDNNLIIRTQNNIKFGFLGFNFVDREPIESDFELIKESKKKVDILIVAVHWGVEYQSKANKNQREWAKNIVDSGADVVVGSHPHWVQNVEVINGKPVYYSLGNFVFDQAWSENTKKGIVIKLTYDGVSLVNEGKMPIYMRFLAQPEFVK